MNDQQTQSETYQSNADQTSAPDEQLIKPRSSGGGSIAAAVFAGVVVFIAIVMYNPIDRPEKSKDWVGRDPVTKTRVTSKDTGIRRVRASNRFKIAKWMMDTVDKVPIGGDSKKKSR